MEFSTLSEIIKGNSEKEKILIVEMEDIGYRGRFVCATTDSTFEDNDSLYLNILGEEVKLSLCKVIEVRFA